MKKEEITGASIIGSAETDSLLVKNWMKLGMLLKRRLKVLNYKNKS